MRNALASEIARFATTDGIHQTAIPRLTLIRKSAPTEPLHGVHQPSVCIIAQGSKRVMMGDQIFVYDADNYLTVSVDVPIVGQVVTATEEEPYLCVRLDIDPAMLAELILDMRLPETEERRCECGMALARTTPELAGAFMRLVSLLASPDDIAMLAPLAEREILYRLLRGPQSAKLRQIAIGDSRMRQINRAIAWLRSNYAVSFSAEALAQEARMSLSSLHFHFKEVTGVSPLNYQKQLRLQEARRLILGDGLDAATAGHRVGYDSPSQFSREYSRLFGAPPRRDIERLRRSPGPLEEA
jgi:AraC-like DNA-binding protein